MSTMETYSLHVDTPRVDGDLASRRPKPLVIGYDLLRAIDELRSVPVLRWPDEVGFDDSTTCGVVDRAEYSAATTNVYDNLPQPEFTSCTMNWTSVSAVSARRSCTTQAVDSKAGRPITTAVDGDLASSSVPPVDRPGRTVGGAHDHRSSAERRAPGSKRLSDDVFVDVLTPIDADLLMDDVYEREMDELDQLDVELIVADDVRDWPSLLPESTAVDGVDQRTHQNYLLIDSFTDRPLMDSRECTAECGFRSAPPAVGIQRTDPHPQGGHLNTSSSVSYRSTVSSSIDTSAEELFEEIVESMTDTVSEDDYELDGQLSLDATNTKSGHGKLETAVFRRNIVSKKLVDDAVTSPAKPLTWPSNRLSRSNRKQDTLEKKRQKDLTVSLASTLNECLKALSRIDASVCRTGDVRRHATGVNRRRKYDAVDSDAVSSLSSTKTSSRTSSEDRRCVTSSSSGFQSDLLDVDIDEEFDANAAFDDADVRATKPTADSTSLDSLLELNDEDEDDDEESYATETIIRRPIPPQSQRLDNHYTVNGFIGKTTVPPKTTIKTEANTTSGSRTEEIIASKLDEDDGTNKKSNSVVAFDDKSPKIEVLAEELITQEIVLNIVLPRRSKKNKERAAVGGCVDRTESVESGVVSPSRSVSDKAPLRDFHIHRIVRCSDADDPSSDDRLAVCERPQSQRQKSATEPEEVDRGANEDDSTPGRSIAARYVGGPLSVELERNAESATTERLDDETKLRVTRRNRVKVLRAPAGSGGALYRAPVTSVGDVVDDVRRTLVGAQQRQSLPAGVRVTCDAVERKSSTSLPVDDVTVVSRIIVDDSDRQ